MVPIKTHVADFPHLSYCVSFFLSWKAKDATFLEGTGVLFRVQAHLQ